MSYSANCNVCRGCGECYSASNIESMISDYGISTNYVSQAINSGYSSLEYTVSNSEIAGQKETQFSPAETGYRKKKYFEGYLTNSKITSFYADSSVFMPQNTETKFIGDVKEISDHIGQAFKIVTGEEFPDDMMIHVCSKERLKEFHAEFGGMWSNGINGFAVNRKISGMKSEIFVCNGQLADVIATLGHEIGHCISAPLDNIMDEEAKAFAFEFAWLKAINENNIAGLRGCFNMMNPAKNNVHDTAFSFVTAMISSGIEAIKLCFGLAGKELSTEGI